MHFAVDNIWSRRTCSDWWLTKENLSFSLESVPIVKITKARFLKEEKVANNIIKARKDAAPIVVSSGNCFKD